MEGAQHREELSRMKMIVPNRNGYLGKIRLKWPIKATSTTWPPGRARRRCAAIWSRRGQRCGGVTAVQRSEPRQGRGGSCGGGTCRERGPRDRAGRPHCLQNEDGYRGGGGSSSDALKQRTALAARAGPRCGRGRRAGRSWRYGSARWCSISSPCGPTRRRLCDRVPARRPVGGVGELA